MRVTLTDKRLRPEASGIKVALQGEDRSLVRRRDRAGEDVVTRGSGRFSSDNERPAQISLVDRLGKPPEPSSLPGGELGERIGGRCRASGEAERSRSAGARSHRARGADESMDLSTRQSWAGQKASGCSAAPSVVVG